MPCLLFVDGGTAYADDWASSEPGRGNPSFKPSPLPLNAGSGPSAFLSAHGVGVVAGAGSASNATLVYNPSTNTWSQGASMPTTPQGTRFAAAFPIPGGAGAVVGGSYGSSIYALNQIYNPATNTWSTGASMPTARRALAAFPLMDGRGAAVGGSVSSTGSSITQLAANEIYDPASNTWSAGASMPTARDVLAAFPLPDGRGVAVGGVSDVGTRVVEVYF